MHATLEDIAYKAGVSKMTVSRVLSGKGHVASQTAEKINRIAAEVGYQPNLIARSLSSKRAMTVGVVIPKTEHIFLDNYIAQILSGVTDVLQKKDYRIMLFPGDHKNNEQEYVNIARSKLVDGIILIKAKTNDPKIDALSGIDFPFIMVNYKKYGKKLNFVDSENIKGARMATRFLYEKGHRKIAFMAGTMSETNAVDRMKGFRDEMEACQLEVRDEWILYGDFNRDTAFREASKLLELKERPTAIFCSDDYMAIAVMERLKGAGMRIPGDIAVIGFDDIEIASYVHPALTTIRQPMSDVGAASGSILLQLIDGKLVPPVHRLLKVELIERESV